MKSIYRVLMEMIESAFYHFTTTVEATIHYMVLIRLISLLEDKSTNADVSVTYSTLLECISLSYDEALLALKMTNGFIKQHQMTF